MLLDEHRFANFRTGLPVLWALGLAVALWAAESLSASPQPASFKIFVESDGAYRVAFEDLGLGEEETASASLGLRTAGKPVALWVADGGDGVFGAGDWFEFVGHGLRGAASYSSEYSRFNVYFLRLDDPNPARMGTGRLSQARTADSTPLIDPTELGGRRTASGLRAGQHLEQDLLLPRLKPRPEVEVEELWYWAKLASLGQGPLFQQFDLSDLDESAETTVELSIHLRGWSKPRRKADPALADHRVNVSLNGVEVAGVEWSGTDPFLLKLPPMPVSRFEAGSNTLGLEVPRRQAGEAAEELVDVVLLNWIEVDYPRHTSVGGSLVRFRLDEGQRPDMLRLDNELAEPLLVYGAEGSRWEVSRKAGVTGVPAEVRLDMAGERSFVAGHASDLFSPSSIVVDNPSSLAAETWQADYLIIAHPRLIGAIQPLADLHRSRGLKVSVVDIEDVYDEFSHGILDPRAVRDFVEHAYRNWRKPTPRFVLLVGDASWDAKNPRAVDANYADWTYRPGERLRFVKNGSTPYPTNADINHRGLIPTWNHATYEGHSASDNFFVAIDGDDSLPDLAIGRLPVVEPAEVAAIVDKTMRYISSPEVGAWRRRALFITNDSLGLQRRSDRLAGAIAGLGLAAEKIYPASSDASNEHHSRRLLQSFDEGQLLVHFLGHGGRYIWRTGPPDLRKNHDLFTLDHLEELRPTDRLSIVLSLTCYSAPFDHPGADSIGEGFLRLPGRGAVSVIAASWRNNPSPSWGEALMRQLAAPAATVGEAMQRAKRTVGDGMFVETYNLLGDPAVPVATPRAAIGLEVAEQYSGFRVAGRVDLESFSGSLIVDLVGEAGDVLASSEFQVNVPAFEVHLDRPDSTVQAVRAYAWNADTGVDAAGGQVIDR